MIVPSPVLEGVHSTLYIEDARVVMGKRLRSGANDQVRAGYLAADPSVGVVVTLTGHHTMLHERLREQLALDLPGIARLRWLGAMPDNTIGYDDVLIEDMPAGRPAIELAPLPEAALIRVGAALAEVLAQAHARGLIAVGVAPEVVYLDRELAFTGLVPRGRRFIATAPHATSGPGSYPVPYDSHETLVLGQPATAASDVSALCMVLHALGTGAHPFGPTDRLAALVARVASDDRDPYPGPLDLAAILASGMARDPAHRPTAVELAEAFASM